MMMMMMVMRIMTCVGSHCCMQAPLAYCIVEHRLYEITNFACESSDAGTGIFLIFLCPLHNLRGPESILKTSRAVAYPGILFGRGSTNSVEDRGQKERRSGGGSPLVRGSEGSCNLVQEISFHIVKFS